MTPEPAILVENLGKRFRLRHAGTRSVKASILDLVRRGKAGAFWALRGADFAVDPGETLGIIGSNGAGKSTLLSLLAGTKTPTEGRVLTRGTVSSLLELGAGFHPDLTGRENVYLAGAVMGVPRRTMRERFDAVVDFAGIGDFIDHPVKHYSSGMYVRLGFAVAVEVNPDILLIDEVLAVGDAVFQRKCLGKMSQFREQGKTMLIISHDLATIQSISDRILLLEEGRVAGLGDPKEVVGHYESVSRRQGAKAVDREWGTGEVKIVEVRFFDAGGRETDTFQSGTALTARIRYRAEQRVTSPVFGFSIASEGGLHVHGSNTQIEGVVVPEVVGEGQLSLAVNPLNLGGGNYLFSFSVHSSDHAVNYHRLDNRFPIAVRSDKRTEGCAVLESSWSL